MSEHNINPSGAMPERATSQTERRKKQLSISLRRAFQTDLDAPVPEHLQRLLDALQKSLKEAGRQK